MTAITTLNGVAASLIIPIVVCVVISYPSKAKKDPDRIFWSRLCWYVLMIIQSALNLTAGILRGSLVLVILCAELIVIEIVMLVSLLKHGC